MKRICKTTVALVATAEMCLAFQGQPYGINPAGWNYFPERNWPHYNIVSLWQDLYPGPEEVYIWFGKEGDMGLGEYLSWQTLYLPYDREIWWEYDGHGPHMDYIDSLVANACRLKNNGKGPVIWSNLFGMLMPKFLPDGQGGKEYIAPYPFGWDEAFPESLYPGQCTIKIRVYTDIPADTSAQIPDYFMGEFSDDYLDTVIHWALAERALGEDMTTGWGSLSPDLHPVAYGRRLSDMSRMAQRMKVLNADDYIDYMVIGAGGFTVGEYYRVFVWDPPLEMGDGYNYPDSIVLCGRGPRESDLPTGYKPYPSPIERTDVDWAPDNLHWDRKKVLPPNDTDSIEVEFCTRVVLLPDTAKDEMGNPIGPSDTTAVVRVHIWAREIKRPMLTPNMRIPPSLTKDFVLVVPHEYRDWVVATTNPRYQYETNLKPIIEIFKRALPKTKIVVFLGEQNAGAHGGTPEPKERWDEYYKWITTHGLLPRYPGKHFWGDSMRSNKMAEKHPNWDQQWPDPTGILDYASQMFLGPHREDMSLIDGIAFNLYICHWAENWDSTDKEADPYWRIGPDMEQIAAFNDSIGGKEILVREIILPFAYKAWDDSPDKIAFPLDIPGFFSYKILVHAHPKEGGF